MPEKYGQDVLEPLLRGLQVRRAEYSAALPTQSKLRVAADQAMEAGRVDALLAPATRIVAPLRTDRFERSDLTSYTRPFNTTGQPVVCLPVLGAGVPVGIQVVGHHGMDQRLVQIASAIEHQWAALIYEGAM